MFKCSWQELFRSSRKENPHSSALRAMGMDQQKRFHRYHRVLSRASWSSRETTSRILLRLLLRAFVAEGQLLLGIDETLERRRLGTED
jgi:hypothetical protein